MPRTRTQATLSLLTTEEAAKHLNVSGRRVLQFIKAGRLPARKIGGHWLITEADLAVFSRKPRLTGQPGFISRSSPSQP